MTGVATQAKRGSEIRSEYEPDGPVLSLSEVALLLWADGLTRRVLPRGHIAMIERRALAKLRRSMQVQRLAREIGLRTV